MLVVVVAVVDVDRHDDAAARPPFGSSALDGGAKAAAVTVSQLVSNRISTREAPRSGEQGIVFRILLR